MCIRDSVKGAFSIGDKYCAFYGADGDMVRITGYLVKKSEPEKYESGEVVLQDNVINGNSNYKRNRLGDRKVRSALEADPVPPLRCKGRAGR